MKEVIVSWSGGKDCTLACYKAIKSGLKVKYLASIITKSSGRLWPHLLSPETLRMQAGAIGITLLEWPSAAEGYDDNYRRMLSRLKEEGVNGVVFGDVNIGNSFAGKHLNWIKSVCEPTGMEYHLPLWEDNRATLLGELIELGFEVRILAADSTELGESWLGRKLDKEMLSELKLRHSLSPNGNVGYYHTFVTDGPIFKSRLVIEEWDRVFDEQAKFGGMGVWYMDIKRCRLESKKADRSPLVSTEAV
ncbi:diphthine--ammonia ligase [Dehalococcoides sp. UCH007]|uniref:Dph6-related ATP pyrophosphatase n=1 Tax=Dehalococcoides sp. UCH007 TaxID=1522671 RepID=UPI0005B561D3|nr:diphthine--ammonia ligase [Dehalococcoides sp. UCH007]BAQ34949.1 putative reductive dehalogenase-associated protein [Dehalococcoides sp. UCH007]